MTQDVRAERQQEIRDLRGQISDLSREDEQEIVFKETSPRRRKATIYSMRDGSLITIPLTLLERTLEKRGPDGKYMFTARKEDAPEFRQGQVKCFLHSDSPERPILEEIGLRATSCPAAHLANQYSKEIHAKHRHKQEWAMYQQYRTDQKEAKQEARQERQLEATLAIAGKAAVAPENAEQPVGGCDICDKTGFKNVGAHKRGAHQA
jgi:hypothetical protein